MKSLFDFILRHYFAFLFFIFEAFNFILIVEYNEYQKQIFFDFSSGVVAYINSISSSVTGYFHLKEENENLLKENAYLKNKLSGFSNKAPGTFSNNSFEYLPATVVSSTVSYRNNFLVVNRGEKDSVRKEMAVVAPSGVVGVVFKTSKHFSSVLSVLNVKSGVSAKIKRLNYPCLVVWDGDDYRYAKIYDLPEHINIKKGDSVVTSGFSSIFPKDIYIGKIVNYKKQKTKNFYNVTIKLGVNFKTVTNVYVVKNKYKAELDSLKRESNINE